MPRRRTERPPRPPRIVSGPTPSLTGGGPSKGGSRASEKSPRPPSATMRPPSSTGRTRSTVRARGPAIALVEAAANIDARTSPTGVAMTNPAFGCSSRTPGVASACRPRNPARGQERERDQHQARVAVATGRDVGDVRQDHVDAGRDQDEPEMARMVLPLHGRAPGERGAAPVRPAGGRSRRRSTTRCP